MKKNEWSDNAEIRYNQIVSGKDLTFLEVFLPFWISYFSNNSFDNVIEVGCGPGVLSKEISKHVNTITCIESDIEMYNIAKYHNRDVENIKIMNLPIENVITLQKFDVCFAHMVFHNITNIIDVLDCIVKFLRNKGELIFSIPHPCFYKFYKTHELKDLEYMKDSKHKINFVISQDNNPLPNKITYCHRNIEKYTQILANNNLFIKEIKEIYPSDQIMGKYNERWEYPRYMILRTKLFK